MSASLTIILTVLVAIGLGLVALEGGRGGARELSLVATLGAAAAAGRVLFAPIPSVQPVTVICLVSGAALGPRAGLTVGPIAALVSNGFLGEGPYTPAQMALWGLAGLSGALLAPLCRRAVGLAIVGAVWGMAFGWAMNLWSLATFGPRVSWAAFLLLSGRSLPFEIAHATGNVILALTTGPALVRMLGRYRLRVRTRLSPPPAPAPAPAAPGVPASPAREPPR